MQSSRQDGSLAVVIRKFQRGAGIDKAWDQAAFEKDVRIPIEGLMKTAPPALRTVVVVSCGDPNSRLREAVDEGGRTPMMRAVETAFPDECARGLVKTVLDTTWGQNPGSASALNAGWRAMEGGETDLVLSWNPEFKLSGHTLAAGLDHMRRYFLPICGFYRERWFERFQWNMFQNTATIYKMSLLEAHGGFSPRCDGNSGETIEIGGRKVALSGMDDFYFYLTAMKNTGKALPWGMYGNMEPSDWEVEFSKPDRQADFDDKVARQLIVMQAWAKEIFPDVPFWRLMSNIFPMLRQA